MTKTTDVQPECFTPEPQSPFVARTQIPAPFTLVIFGATGDLAARKLLPALWALWRAQYLPEEFILVGVGRRDKSNQVFRDEVRKSIVEFGTVGTATANCWNDFLAHVFYQPADVTSTAGMQGLADRLQALETAGKLPGNRLFYLAVDPEFFGTIVEGLAGTKMARPAVEKPWTRIVIEKPFGHDLASALALDRHVSLFFRPEQIYRIDHYLGKETVQNLLAFRFGNAIFEPLFNRHHVDHVQITVAETVGMEGKRGVFYDHTGALRDVVQNHMLQLLALVAMDPPATLKAGDVSDAKLKVLRNLVPLHGADVARCVVRGQYGTGTVAGQPVRAYLDEEGVAKASKTESYVALRAEVGSWRWAGVPFLLRTGKRLPSRVTEIAIQFKLPPLLLFRTVECVGDFCDLTESSPNVLVFRIQPNEGISLSFSAKRPGMQLDLHSVRFNFDYGTTFQQALPEAYERLLLDALRGDATLFMRSDELDAAWTYVTPILEAWGAELVAQIPQYAAGTWGPAEANRLLKEGPGGWRQP